MTPNSTISMLSVKRSATFAAPLRIEPSWRPLHDNPRFQKLIAEPENL